MTQAAFYTREDVEAALKAIHGERAYGFMAEDPHRHLARDMERAASKAWLEERPEDEHSRILRTALNYLNRTGVLLPEDRASSAKGI